MLGLLCISSAICLFFKIFSDVIDSPAVPESANTQKIFRGFSFVATDLVKVQWCFLFDPLLTPCTLKAS